MSDLTPIYMILIYVPIYALLRPGRDRAGYNGIPARCRRIPVRDRNGDAAGDICGLVDSDIVSRTATLRQTKNGTMRGVPLSRCRAARPSC